MFQKTAGGYYQAHNSTIAGDVTIGKLCSFWFNVVVRGDVAPIVIGRQVNVQDHAVIHCESGVASIIEEDVTIAHGAIVHGQQIGRGSLIGIGARVLGRSVIGKECLIAAGAVVPPGMNVPDGMVVMGMPGRVVRKVTEEDLRYMRWIPGHYVELAERWVRGEFEIKRPNL